MDVSDRTGCGVDLALDLNLNLDVDVDVACMRSALRIGKYILTCIYA